MPYQLGECPGILAANGQAAIDGLPAGLFMLQLAFHALIAKIQAPHQPGSTLGHKPAASSRAVPGEGPPTTGRRGGDATVDVA